MSGLNLLRQKYPDHLADLNDYEAVNKIAELTGQKADAVASDLGVQMPTLASELAKGVSSGVDQIQGSLYGAGTLAADLVGADRIRDWAMEGAQRNQLEAQETAAAVDDIRKIGGLRDGALWASHVVGAQLPQLVGSLTPAGLGARYAGKKALASALERGLSKEAAQAAATKAAGLGAYAGGGAYGATMESGDNFLSIYDRTGEYQPGNALAHGVPAGALEGLSDRFLLKGVGAGRPAGMSRTAYVGQQAGQQAAISGVLEEVPQDLLAQHALDTAAPGYEYDGWRTANAAAAGAVGGGVIGGGFAALTPSEKTYDKVGDVARDPIGKTVEAVHSVVRDKSGDKELDAMIKQRDDMLAAGVPAKEIVETILKRKGQKFTDPLNDEERGMDDRAIDARRSDMAMQDAQEVLNSAPGMYSQAERDAAAKLIAGEVSWDKVREIRRQGDADRKAKQQSDDMVRAFGLDEDDLRSLEQQTPETKNSLMRPTLTDDFGEQEGRAMDDDTVTDDFGNTARTSPTSDMGLPRDERGFGSAVRRVTALQRKWDKEATKEQAERTVEVADVLVSGGYWPKEIVEAAKSTTQKSELLTQAATMLSWMKYGMKDKRHPTDPESATDALVLNYGASVLKMFDNAYEVAVSTGLTTRDDNKAQETRTLLLQAVADRKAHADIVMKNLSAEWKNNVKSKEDLETLVREVRRMVNTGSRKALRSEGPNGEKTTDEKVLTILFPNPANRLEVQHALYDRRASNKAFGAVSPTAELGEERGEVTRAGKRTKGADDMDSGDFTRLIDELDGGAANPEKEVREGAGGVAYLTRPGGHAFRKRDEGARAALAEAKTNARVPGVRVEEVGAVTAALDKARRDKGEALSVDEKEDVQVRAIRRYMRKALPERPTAPPQDASAIAKNMYKQDLARWKTRLSKLATAVDRTHVVVKTVETKADVVNAELDYEAVRASQLNRQWDDPRNRPEEGTLWIGTKRGAKMLISAPQVLRLAFGNRSADNHQDVGFSGKTKDGDEAQINFGSAQNIYNTLLRSMGDISLMDQFDGTWGYVEAGGKPVAVSDTEGAAGKPGKFAKVATLPKNFTLLKKNDKRDALTIGDVADAKEGFSARLSELNAGDVDQDDIGQPTHRKMATVYEKIFALQRFLDRAKKGAPREDGAVSFAELALKNFDERPPTYIMDGQRIASPELKKTHYDLKRAVDGLFDAIFKEKDAPLDSNELARLEAFLKHVWDQHRVGKENKLPQDMRFSRNTHILLGKWIGALGLSPGDVVFAEGHHEVDQAVDGLAAYDPPKSIVRGDDDKGMVTTSNISMQAQTVIGRSGAGTKPVPTLKPGDKITDERFVNAADADTKSVGTAARSKRKRLEAVANNKDIAWDFPSDKLVHDMALNANDGPEALRMLDRHEMRSVTEAIQSMPIVRAMIRAGYVDHIAIDNNLTGGKLGYMKSFEPEGYTLKQVVVLSPLLFGDKAVKRLSTIAHEVAHTLEGVVGLGQFKKFGRMAALARKIDPETKLGKMLKMPLQEDSFNNKKSTSFAQELHAQLFAAYVHPRIRNELKQHQELFYRLDKLYGDQAKLLRALTGGGRGARPNAAQPRETPSRGAGVERGVSDTVRGDVRRPEQPTGQGISGELPPTVKERLIKNLSTIEPVSREHAAAVKHALAVLKGEKEGPTDAALYRVFDASGYLGKPTQRPSLPDLSTQPKQEQATDEYYDSRYGREGYVGSDKPSSYYDEYGFDPELAEVDTAMFEEPGQVVEPQATQTAAGQLQAYLDANKGKNAVWEKAATKAIAEKNEKQIAGALAAAKKQFGELDTATRAKQPDTNQSKQDAWVMKVASMSMKDMKAYIASLPKEKLNKAYDLIESFNPDNYETDTQERVAAAALDALRDRLDAEDGETKYSEQTPSDQAPITPEQALADIARMLGKDYDAQVVADLGGKAGQWTPHGIRLAATAPNGTQYHEALHELFSQLRKHGAENVVKVIERVTQNPIIMRKLEQQLEGHPKAIKQLKKPEEAAAFLFQFWNMGLINIGPETKTLFQTIKDWLVEVAKDIHAIINNAKRDERKAEKAQKLDEQKVRDLFDAFASGVAANPDSRQALYDALRKNAEVHQKTIDELGMRAERFWQGVGRYVISSESMLNSYSKHPELKIIADAFHQMAGKSMKNMARVPSLDARGGFFEATHQESQRRLAKFERFLERGNYDQKDFEIALKYLESGKGNSSDAKVAKLVDFIRDYYGEMFDYITKSDVRRLDPTSEQRWVPVEKRKNYWSQVWNVEGLMNNHDGFVADLLATHPRELQHMADEANKEIEAWEKMTNTTGKVKSPTAQAEIDKKLNEFNESGQIIGKVTYDKITPEAVAETIYTRLINSMGMVDMQETEWSLGITPGASAVNRRQLDWLDKEVFSKYKSKDLVNIVTTYTRTMVKRAESQKRFGYGGERISDAVDTAFLREMGGQALVDEAVAELPEAIKQWKKDAAEWHEDNQGVPYPEPYPTLRLVGVEAHRAKVGAEASNKALITAEEALRPVVNAIRAQEGTLGNEISPTMRAANSWINTYTSIRLLPFALFTNLSDVIGITVQGGTLGDAWDAFVSGMREVRNTWINKKGDDNDTLRAEDWGIVDAGLLLDTLGQSYGSVYMTPKAQRINNRFFRIIGMEGWNRGLRATAAKVGERIISDWATNGVDFSKPGEKSRFERLYGKGANPKAIKLDSQGRLDTSNAANRAAIQRFVQDAVMSSNAAHRTFWMSDQRFATFAHLKNYAYTFHSVMLKNIIDQGMQGNLRPALVAGLGYASISIAAGAVKEMLIPGDEPFWMKGGLDGYLDYGLGQANLGGVPQLWAEGVTDLDPAKLAGPFWDQLQNLVSSPLPGFSLNLSPVNGDTEILKDRKVLVEMARAIPPATLTGRGMDSLVGD